jgi:hypothetical protein
MGYVLVSQISNYNALLGGVTVAGRAQDALVLTLSRSLDAAVIKTCSIFVAFLLIFLGGVYSMTVARATYKLSVGGTVAKGVLETASPGLVMLTLGAALVWVTVSKEHVINYTSSVSQPDAINSQERRTNPAADEPRARGQVEVTTTTSSPKFVMSQVFDEDDVRAVTTTLALVAGHRDALTAAEANQWSTVRAHLDLIRKTIALSRYPSIADSYDAVVQDAATGGKTELGRLSITQRQDFQAVQRLLGESLPLR